MIPKILFQTSRERPDAYVQQEFSRFLGPGWEYRHFTDDDIFQYFARNPLPEFPGMSEKFRQMPRGASAADLFRYYHLYVEGGVFLDSDTMLKAPLDSIAADCDFFSARSGYLPGSLFNGFIGCSAGHPLMRMALEDAYHVDLEKFGREYHLLCVHLYDMLAQHGHKYRVRLFDEVMLNNGMCEIVDASDRIVLMHYFANKVVPRRIADSRPVVAAPVAAEPQDVLSRLFALARSGKLPPELRTLAIEKLKESGNQGLLDAFLAVGEIAA